MILRFSAYLIHVLFFTFGFAFYEIQGLNLSVQLPYLIIFIFSCVALSSFKKFSILIIESNVVRLLIPLFIFLLYRIIMDTSELPDANAAFLKSLASLGVILAFSSSFFVLDHEDLIKCLLIALSLLAINYIVLIIVYRFYFDVGYVGSNLFEENRYGRNQLAYFSSKFLCLLPIAAVSSKKYFGFIAFIGASISVGVLLSGSRGGLILLILYLIAGISYYRGFFKNLFNRIDRSSYLLYGGVTLLALHLITSGDLPLRIISLVSPDSLPDSLANYGKHSSEERWFRINQSFDFLEYYAAHFTGIGTTWLRSETLRGLPHNDYVNILVSYGVVGLSLYVALHVYLFLVYLAIYKTAPHHAFAGMAIVFLNAVTGIFYDSYQSVYPYLLMVYPFFLLVRRNLDHHNKTQFFSA